MKTLDKSQIKALNDFVKSHYVPYYDVQMELVDHMANAIENLWGNDPNISFNVAKETVFNRFGVFGFQPILEEKQKTLQKRYNRLLFNALFDYFKLPKILLLLTTVFALFMLFREIAMPMRKTIIVAILLLNSLIALYLAFRYRKRIKQKTKITGKSWLFEASSTREIITLILIIAPIQLLNLANVNSTIWVQDSKLFILVTLLVLVVLAVYIMFYVLPSKIRNIIKKEYPHFDFV